MTNVTTTSRAPIRDRLAKLSAMSTRELNDIGIDRADIRSIAGRAAYGA